MVYSLNGYYKLSFSNRNVPRVLVYPNNTTAANLLNHHKSKGASVIEIAGCIADDAARLPMPITLMSALDAKIREVDGRAIVVGIDAYLSLLAEESVTAFMVELRNRIDGNSLNADYLLSEQNKPNFDPRYMESLHVIYLSGDEECLDPLSIEAYSDKWVKPDTVVGYKALLVQLGYYMPSGNHTLVLKGLDSVQAGIGNTVSFILGTKDIAERHYGIISDLSDATLETLLTKASESCKMPENYLEGLFDVANISVRLALKRLLELPADDLWSTYIWLLRRRLPSNSYIAKVISGNVTRDNLLRKYAVDTAVSALSDINAQQYATERAEALKEIGTNYESLIVEFIGQTRNANDALRFLNCGTGVERVEILRRASLENLNYGLPKQYAELFPVLADYFSTEFDYDDFEIASYFKEYRKLKVSNSITDEFVQLAYDLIVPRTFATRDAVLAELKAESDIALLVVDAMGVEYMPLLLALAKHRGMSIELQSVVTAKLPTETIFNPIEWDDSRTLPEIRSIDDIVHDGAAKHEVCTPERNFAETLRIFETEIMNRIADGLTSFNRIVVTADHGASRLAVIARRENKGETLPWDGQPDDWRYSLAPQGVPRPSKLEQEYFPETKETYWIVRGYNRLPKMGGKLYELHGGASPEERLVPIVVFTRNTATEVPKQLGKKAKTEIVDEFEGLI